MTATHPITPSADPGLFQCGSCKRKYKRLDHLARHVRSRKSFIPSVTCTGVPFILSISPGYSDILKRHIAGHKSQGTISVPEGAPSSASQEAQDAPGTSRVSQACRSCASNHLRCTEQKPCLRCADRGVECEWDQAPEMELTPPQTGPSIDAMESFELDVTMRSPDESARHEQITPSSADMTIPPESTMSTDATHPMASLPDWDFMPGQWTPMGALAIDLAPDIELEDIDLRFLDAYNVNIPFEFTQAPAHTPNAPPLPPPTDPCRAAALATEAFHNSHWRFRPNAQDHGAAEEHNLSLPATADHASPESRVPFKHRATGATLAVSTRDKILTMVVESCRPENLSRAVASFPSVELLDSLLQYSLTSPIARFDSFLHAATFNPNEKRTELLAAMAARGAVLTADPALTKLGYAMQESVRVAVPKHWERDNSLIRDQELAQAFLITLEIGLWSGHGRKIEIAESFLQPALTMLRRGGKLRNSSYPHISVHDDDEGESLQRTWHSWAHQESFKRLAFRLIQHDTDCSMALLVNPLVSYAEVQLPLPAPDALWLAPTAEAWKAAFLSLPSSASLTVADFLDEPEGLQTHRGIVDAAAASLAFLSCAWTLTWELVQFSSLQRSRPRRWNALLTSSRQDELLKLLNNFRISMDAYTPCAQDLIMRLEITLLHLHVPFDDIQLFAGMEGPDQARVVYPTILAWAGSEGARNAVWHAGQVIRVARALPPSMLQGHAATMVYHATLALWVYGLVFDGPSEISVKAGDMSAMDSVCIDDADSILLQRFIQFGRGNPCIRGMPNTESQYGEPLQTVHLRDADMVVDTIARILRANHDGMSRSRLVDQLIQLMDGLQGASRRAISL